jgi:hypothetical protein
MSYGSHGHNKLEQIKNKKVDDALRIAIEIENKLQNDLLRQKEINDKLNNENKQKEENIKKENIATYLLGYEKVTDFENLKIDTHMRYFIGVRLYPGGYLVKININKNYIRLSKKPNNFPNWLNKLTGNIWNVNIDECVFYSKNNMSKSNFPEPSAPELDNVPVPSAPEKDILPEPSAPELDQVNIVPNQNNGHSICTVCSDDILQDQESIRTTCEHKFHRKCIANWLCQQNTCPNCRSNVL